VVAKIDEFAPMLRDKTELARDRIEALKKFVVDFVADVHQQLHAAKYGDRGGNDVKVTFLR
jgi:S1/P1 nuclease